VRFSAKENRPKRGGCDLSDFSTSSFYFIKPEKNTDNATARNVFHSGRVAALIEVRPLDKVSAR